MRAAISAPIDADNGKLAWRFYIVPGDPKKQPENAAMAAAMKTWSSQGGKFQWWKMGGGGSPWDSMSYDPKLDLLYVGTGNGAPWNRNMRSPGGGDNLYLSSILAIKPETGKLVWYYQTTPGDTWDFDSTSHMILADLTIDGKLAPRADPGAEERLLLCDRSRDRKADLGQALCRDELGAPASIAKTGKPNRKIRPRATRTRWPSSCRRRPARTIGSPWRSTRRHGLVYIPAMDGAAIFVPQKHVRLTSPRAWNTGNDFAGDHRKRC